MIVSSVIEVLSIFSQQIKSPEQHYIAIYLLVWLSCQYQTGSAKIVGIEHMEWVNSDSDILDIASLPLSSTQIMWIIKNIKNVQWTAM